MLDIVAVCLLVWNFKIKCRLKLVSDGICFQAGLTAASAVCTAAAFAAVVLKLQLGHDGGVGIMFALLRNVVFIIWDTGHQVCCQLDGFPPRGKLMLHAEPPAVYRRGTLLEFL